MALYNDTGILARFDLGQIKGEVQERVHILNPVSNEEYVARAHSMSHRDPNTNEDVTYAQRFATQYAAFLQNKDKNIDDKIAEAKATLAALEGTQSGGDVTDAQRKKAEAEAAKKAAEEAAKKTDFSTMSDDQLRAHIEQKAGKKAPANANRETLIRMAEEV